MPALAPLQALEQPSRQSVSQAVRQSVSLSVRQSVNQAVDEVASQAELVQIDRRPLGARQGPAQAEADGREGESVRGW